MYKYTYMNIHISIAEFGRKGPSHMYVGPKVELRPHVFICVYIYVWLGLDKGLGHMYLNVETYIDI